MTDTRAPQVIRLHAADNVVVAARTITIGEQIGDEQISSRAQIPMGHKLATTTIAPDQPIRKFNQIIGFATAAIEPGDHVHTHNCGMRDFERDYAFCTEKRELPTLETAAQRTFLAFRRDSGRIGTRNYLGIVTSVNCSATVARFIAEEAERSGVLEDYPTVDGIVALVHGTGCGMAGNNAGFENLERTLLGFAGHPNFAGVLVVGLGCEVMQIPKLLKAGGLSDSESMRSMTIQGMGGTRKTVAAGVEIIKEMLPLAAQAQRERVPASELTLALQCGGSDGYSGITANPSLGRAADLIVQQGGTVILSETPEIYGAEHLLTRRAVSSEIGKKLVERIHWWEDYTQRNGGEMNNNPSPGNKAGGLTTILEKSLGAAAKGGTTNLTGVYRYAESVTNRGFVFMDSPGYDPCSITGQVASGANVICFTTGRGSVYGCKPVPSIKLATNTPMYQNMSEDMDINCGEIVDGTSTVQTKGKQIFDFILETASGRPSCSERLGFGSSEFVPWQIGAVM